MAGNKTKSRGAHAGSIVACTIALADELPRAIVLANCFARLHPDTPFAVLVMGRSNTAALPANAKLLSLSDLGFDPAEEYRLPMLFSPGALRAYLEPALLEMLLRTNAGPVAYFSSSTQIFTPLFDLFERAGANDAVAATAPVQSEWGDSGASFVVARPGSEPLLRESFERFRNGAATSEELTKSLLSAIRCRTIHEPGFAVHYLNLDAASLTRSANGYEINGEPLRSFDFRGYDPDKPHLLSQYQGPKPRILLSEFPLIQELCDNYRQQLLEAGYPSDRSGNRTHEFLPSGLHLDERMLRAYRESFAEFRSGLSTEPISPFGPEGEQGFLKWLNEPVDKAGKGVTRYMLAVYPDRPDVMKAFPDPRNRDAAAFRHWYIAFGSQELNLPGALVPSQTRISTKPAASAPVNVAGYFRAELGLGTAARSLVAALEAAEIPINTVTFDRTANRLAHSFTDRAAKDGGVDINIVCINPDQIAAFAEQTGPDFWHGRYSIGVWFWEVEDFPAWSHHAFNYVDEIWVASEFMRHAFLKVSPRPVFKFPLPVRTPTIDESLSRADLKLPEQFIFLFSFDFLSVLERKNPLGLIQAFCRAFAPSEGPHLVIKTINGDKRITEMEKLKYAIRDRPDIVLKDGYLAPIENATLTALSDCYVSLHRSEGFGLTIAEAMALGKPAIATAYSGNLEFMTRDNSYLCPASRSEVGPECEPYPRESHWSEPDVVAAADLLRHVYTNRSEALALGARAASDLRSAHSPVLAGNIINDRLSVIRGRRANRGPVPSIGLLQDRLGELEALLSARGPENAVHGS
jgi:glycosyltransferase involved in cell wall biosynthesis